MSDEDLYVVQGQLRALSEIATSIVASMSPGQASLFVENLRSIVLDWQQKDSKSGANPVVMEAEMELLEPFFGPPSSHQ